ncbi:CC_3452 family protein [Tsuneonella sp. HG222]
MNRPLAAFAIAAAALTATAAPALAVSREAGPYYRAELSAPAGEAKVIAGGILWNCSGTECTAPKNTSRPVIVCRKLAGETAAVTKFMVAGQEMGAEDLARCNG